MNNDLDYHLDDPGEIFSEKESSKRRKLIIILVSIIILLSLIIIIGIILSFTLGKKEQDKEEDKKEDREHDKEKDEEIPEYSIIYLNISTSENHLIRNSFKKDGENYNPKIGDINNYLDYNETDRDNFDICIPENIMKNKDKYVTIVLNIHGGGWMQGNKADVYETSKSPLYKDFIVATMSYTLVNGDYKEYNIFRIIDEITAVIKSLKQFLIKLGFNGNKLELILE